MIYLPDRIGPWLVEPLTLGHYSLLHALGSAYTQEIEATHEGLELIQALTICRLETDQAIDWVSNDRREYHRALAHTKDSLSEDVVDQWVEYWRKNTTQPLVQWVAGPPGFSLNPLLALAEAADAGPHTEFRRVIDRAFFAWAKAGYLKAIDEKSYREAEEKLEELFKDGEERQSPV